LIQISLREKTRAISTGRGAIQVIPVVLVALFEAKLRPTAWGADEDRNPALFKEWRARNDYARATGMALT
jgi:hypothetical protein